MKVKTNYEGCPYITPGKEYETLENNNTSGVIMDDRGKITTIIFCFCSHIDDNNWEIIGEEDD